MGKERTKVNADRQRQRFSRELKVEAVRLLELGNLSRDSNCLEFEHVQAAV